MLDAAKIITDDSNVDCTFWDKIGNIVQRADQFDERFDLVICSYTLNEFTNDISRRAATQLLFELLDVGGMLVIIEPGNPFGSHTTRSARKFILETFNEDYLKLQSSGLLAKTRNMKKKGDINQEKEFEKEKEKEKEAASTPVTMILQPPKTYSYSDFTANVVAPCTHDRPCPLGDGMWCSFSQKVYSSMIRKGSEEKFSYVIIQKRLKNSRKKEGDKDKDNNSNSDSNITNNNSSLWFAKPPSVATHSSSGKSAKESSSTASAQAGDSSEFPTPLQVLKRLVDPEVDTRGEYEDRKEILDKLVDEVDWDEYQPVLYREEWGRVLRSPIKGKGHITVDMCVPSGLIVRSILSRSGLNHFPALFIAARKTTWGGLIPVILEDPTSSPLMKNAKVRELDDKLPPDIQILQRGKDRLHDDYEHDYTDEEILSDENLYMDPKELFGDEADIQSTRLNADKPFSNDKQKFDKKKKDFQSFHEGGKGSSKHYRSQRGMKDNENSSEYPYPSRSKWSSAAAAAPAERSREKERKHSFPSPSKSSWQQQSREMRPVDSMRRGREEALGQRSNKSMKKEEEKEEEVVKSTGRSRSKIPSRKR
jgi:ribosomal protein RSM22 (predicted rRNA methylase)